MADFDMANHRSSGRKKSRGRSGGGDRFRRRSRGRDEKPEMHEVICDECGNKCQVPFKPTSSKPVYCSECFEKKGSSRKGPNKGSNQSSEELEKINQKLDKILKALKIDR